MIPTPLLFPFRPVEATRRIAQRPVLWPTLTLACIAAVAALAVRWPLVIDAAVRHLPAGATHNDRLMMHAYLQEEFFVRCAVLPMVVAVEVAAFSILVSALARFPSTLRPLRFRSVMVLCTHAALVYYGFQVLAQFLGWSPFMNHGLGVPGLTWIIGTGGNYSTAALIRSVNVLTLYGVVLVAAGLRVLFEGSALRSCLVAIAAWIVSVLANLWLIRLMHDTLHLSA